MPFGQSDIWKGLWSWASAISTAAKRAILFEMQNRRIWEPSDTFWQRAICRRVNSKSRLTGKIIFELQNRRREPATFSRWIFSKTFRNCEKTSRNCLILFYFVVEKMPFAAACVNSNSCHCGQRCRCWQFPLKCRTAQVQGRICNLFNFCLLLENTRVLNFMPHPSTQTK